MLQIIKWLIAWWNKKSQPVWNSNVDIAHMYKTMVRGDSIREQQILDGEFYRENWLSSKKTLIDNSSKEKYEKQKNAIKSWINERRQDKGQEWQLKMQKTREMQNAN